MPIKPENLHRYPGGSIRSPEWMAIREAIGNRAGWCCEECGVRHGAIGLRLPDDSFLDLAGFAPGDLVPIIVDKGGCLIDMEFKVIRVVCTVAHRDWGLDDHRPENLAFWCQLHHNRHDGPERGKNAAATRAARPPRDLIEWIKKAAT